MPYLNLDPNYFDHPKTRRLVGLLGPMADTLPIRIWAYCAKFHPIDGRMKGYSGAELEAIIQWHGASGAAIAALVKVGYLLEVADGLSCVDWRQHEGHLAAFSRRGKAAAKARWDRYATSIPEVKPKPCKSNAPSVPIRTVPAVPNQTNRKKRTTTAPAAPKESTAIVKTEPTSTVPEVASPPKPLTPSQIVVRYFKEAKGVLADDKDWDRKHWNGRLGKEAAALLKAFDGDAIRAGQYLLVKGEEWKDLPDWGINGVIAAAGRDPRLNAGRGEESHERENVALDAGVPHGPRRLSGVTRAGEVAGDALASLRQQAALPRRGQEHLGGPGQDQLDDEPFGP